MYNLKKMTLLNFKIKLTLVFGFISLMGYSQVNMELPVLSPQSPTAADLGKYGEIQVNESTGTVSPSIPLFEYKAGNFTLPIALQYSGNGVRVNQDPTWTGINWNLNPGGVITREVRDKIDEATSVANSKYYSETQLEGLTGAHQMNGAQYSTGTQWYGELALIAADGVDSEADIFNYNFLGYSGSFYIKKNSDNVSSTQFEVHLIKYNKELKILFNYATISASGNTVGNSTITIITPEGDSYYFGGETASEISRTFVAAGSGSTANVDYAQNAFYLKQISFFNGGAVNFTYDTFDTTADWTKIGIQEGLRKSATSGCIVNPVRTLNLDVIRLVKLNKISNTFNSQTVEFDVSSYGLNNRLLKLNNIYLRPSSGAATFIKKINLSYYTIPVTEVSSYEKKFFLTQVNFYKSDNTFEYDYELTYDSPDLFPSKDSFAQDELGYYNGINSNTTLLPITSNTNLNSCSNLANREADYSYAKLGSLKRIKYPTGGYTDFEYELPFKGLVPKPAVNVNMATYYREPLYNETSTAVINPPLNRKQYFNILYPSQGEPIEFTAASSQITFNLSVSAYGSYTNHNNGVLISVYNSTGLVWTNELNGINPPVGLDIDTSSTSNTQTNSYNPSYTCTVGPGTYYFKLTIDLYTTDANTNNRVTANLQIGLPDGYRNSYYPGLRVKKVTTAADASSDKQITRYYYNSKSNINVESYSYHPNFINVTRELNAGDPSTAPLNDYYNLTSSSLKNPYNMNEPVYNYVTLSYGGDNFQNGGKQMAFKKYSNYPPTYYVTNLSAPYYDYDFSSYVDVGTNDSYQNSILEEEIYYNSASVKLKKVNYTYEPTTPADHTMNNIKLYRIAPGSSTQLDFNVYLLYRTNSYKYRLTKTKTEEYLNGDPLTPVVTEVINSYDTDKVSLPKTVEAANSLGETKTTNIYYPSNVTPASGAPQITGFTGGEISILNALQTANNVAQILRTEDKLNGTLLETKQYAFDSAISSKLPSGIKSAKAADLLEDRVQFLAYNAMGSPTLVSLKNGSKTAYLYNGNQQVVLKIENYDNSTLDDGANSGNCFYQNLYTNSMVTQYIYDTVTSKLIRIIDPKCDVINYNYDTFGRLKSVTDKDGNILNENEYHFKP